MTRARHCWRALSIAAAIILFVVALVPPGRAGDTSTGVIEAERCDPIDPSICLFPFPNDYFTVADDRTDTGRRVNLSILSTPRNRAGKPIEPAEWNRNDGFSPGSMILTHVPGVDLAVTGAPPITDIERSLDVASPIVLLNADSGERHMFWAELDANATSEQDQALILRPAVNLAEGARYIVALSNMRRSDGELVAPSPSFQALRDRTPSSDPVLEARRPHMEDVFAKLEEASIDRRSLYLAWDFTVASERSLSERMLHVRDDAFSSLGDHPGDRRCKDKDGGKGNGGGRGRTKGCPAKEPEGESPRFTIDRVTSFSPEQNARVARRVEGTFEVPSYLTYSGACADTTKAPQSPPISCTGAPGSRFNYLGATDATGARCTALDAGCLPARLGGVASMTANFVCNIPRAALGDGSSIVPSRPSLYGHGLLGGAGEVNAGNVAAMGNEHNMMFCATNWIGMATEDLPNIATILADVSNFPTLADRVQQGMLNFLFLGRLMIHRDGFAAHSAFQAGSPPRSLIDRDDLFYDGNSQGGIIGGALTAVAQDFTRAVLGVPGMNYSTLLNRSVDFDPFSIALFAAYPDKMEQQLIYALIQMLWDRAEANGYAHHMTDDPYPNTPSHKVLLHEAFGDHQVANVSTEVEARTIGAHVYQPALDPGRHSDVDPFFGIPSILSFPFDGSALIVWDSGTPTPPIENVPPRAGSDPHSRPRAQVSARLQKATFLQTDGYVADVCNGLPCKAP